MFVSMSRKSFLPRTVLIALAACALIAAIAAIVINAIDDAKGARRALAEGTKADRILVKKAERKLFLLKGASVLREYRVALGFTPVGAKEIEGDGKTPEGVYVIDSRNPKSQYHLSLHVSYPTAEQTAKAKKQGVSAGGMIMIHGMPNRAGELGRFAWPLDWTAGCIAVTNAEIEEIWRVVPDGTPIDIRA